MPDTGSPWNIPYVEAADLVRDWPADSLLVANAVAAGLTAANVGIGSNVVQTVITTTFTTTSTSDVLITGLEATITPTSASSKILVLAQVRYGHATAGDQVSLNIYRGGSAVGAGTDNLFVGSRPAAATAVCEPTAVYVDSPNTTSATTYDVRVRVNSGTGTINRRGSDTNAEGTCTLTLIEVAA